MFRTIGEADCADYAALVRRSFSGIVLDPPPSAARLTEADVRQHLAAGGCGIVSPLFTAGLLWAEKAGGWYISRVAVDPASRRRGEATALLAAVEAAAIQCGVPHLWLSTRLALAGNRRLFQRFGFIETALHAHDGFAAPTFVDMTKPLPHEPSCSPGV